MSEATESMSSPNTPQRSALGADAGHRTAQLEELIALRTEYQTNSQLGRSGETQRDGSSGTNRGAFNCALKIPRVFLSY